MATESTGYDCPYCDHLAETPHAAGEHIATHVSELEELSEDE